MTDWMLDPAVRNNGDGTYTLADENGRVSAWCWRIVPFGGGWRAYAPDDNFGASVFASAADAIGAVLGDPAQSHIVGGRLWTNADCGFAR